MERTLMSSRNSQNIQSLDFRPKLRPLDLLHPNLDLDISLKQDLHIKNRLKSKIENAKQNEALDLSAEAHLVPQCQIGLRAYWLQLKK